MVIGGDARISEAVVWDSHGILIPDNGLTGPSVLVEVPDLTLDDVNGDSWDLGPVQLLDLTIDPMLPCLPAASPNDPLSVATGYVVAGAARAPVQR
jgi:hypothetical protein